MVTTHVRVQAVVQTGKHCPQQRKLCTATTTRIILFSKLFQNSERQVAVLKRAIEDNITPQIQMRFNSFTDLFKSASLLLPTKKEAKYKVSCN